MAPRILCFLKRILAERKLIEDLKDAIKNKNIDLYYQPIIDSKTKFVLGVEALARWHHPEQGLIMPIKLIGSVNS